MTLYDLLAQFTATHAQTCRQNTATHAQSCRQNSATHAQTGRPNTATHAQTGRPNTATLGGNSPHTPGRAPTQRHPRTDTVHKQTPAAEPSEMKRC